MADSDKQYSEEARERRPRAGQEASASRPRPKSPSADRLRELAEELEEHGRALIARARELQRMAGGDAVSRERAANRGPARAGGGGASPQRKSTERRGSSERDRPRGNRDSGGGGRPKRSYGESPEWAPTPKRRKT